MSRDLCAAAMPDCTHRFVYEWDEVGQLVRARRWDYPSGEAPAFDPNAPAVWDVRYAHSHGGRSLTSKTDALLETRHTLEVFDTLRVSSVTYSEAAGDFVIHDSDEVGFVGGVGRVFYDRDHALPQAGPTPVHVYLTIGDHLGSTAFVLDKDSGEVVERSQHQAYGRIESDYRPDRWGANREEYKFTGKGEDIEVGATYFGARFYSPHLGRWLSPDPLTIHGLGADPNPYAYVSGRVSAFVDPFGLDTSCGDRCQRTDDVIVEGTPPPRPAEVILDETAGGDPSAKAGSNAGWSRDLDHQGGSDRAARRREIANRHLAELARSTPQAPSPPKPILGGERTIVDDVFDLVVAPETFLFGSPVPAAAPAGGRLVECVIPWGPPKVVRISSLRRVRAYDVGTHAELRAASSTGDALDLHHVGQAHVMRQTVPGYNSATAPTIALPEAEHAAIPTLRGTVDMSPRSLLARDIWNLRRYTDAPNSALQQLIDMNKVLYPEAFGR